MSTPTVIDTDRATYEVLRLLHQRFRPYFNRDGVQPRQIQKSALPFFLDNVASAVQYLTQIVKPDTTLPALVVVLYRECIRTMLLSCTLNQFPVPPWCPAWSKVDELEGFRCSWDPVDALPSYKPNVAAPPTPQQQNPTTNNPPPYSFIQKPTQSRQPSLLASPAGFGLPQADRSSRSDPATPKDPSFGHPPRLLQTIAGTPVNTVNPSTPSSSKTVPATPKHSAPPISTLSATGSPATVQKRPHAFLLPPKSNTPTPNAVSMASLAPSTPIAATSSPMANQDDQLVSSSPERPLASLVRKSTTKFPVSDTIRPGTFAPSGKQRKTPVKPPVSRPPRSPSPEQAPVASSSKAQGKKRARPESDFDIGPMFDDLPLEPPKIPTIRLPPRKNSSPETIQRRQVQPSAQTAGAAASDIKVVKKPKLVEETSDGSQDETSEVEPDPKSSKSKKAKKGSKKKRSAKPTPPAVRKQQQERYRNAAFPGLAWSADLKLPVIDNAEAFKHFETSLVQITPVPQSRTSESRTFRASKIDIPDGFILSSELPGFISIDVLKRMNFSAHTNHTACCACISQTMTKECEGRGPGEKCVNCRTGSCSTHGGHIRQELQSMASSRQVLESSPLIASQLNRMLILQENIEAELNMMDLHVKHFECELVVLRGMMRDIPRVLWQIEQANPHFKWTDEFLMKLAEIAGWTMAPTVEDAMALSRQPTTAMMRRFHPIYPDVANIGCSRSAEEVAFEADGMQLQYPDEGADSAPQATGSPSSR
ncbi:hypothetical protein K435DRAFT_811576 [Dendrothele bispora CBS 962.96]|uniref:Uncharacterized protein n=1 Tax=Dendrothele bispora (strain CBS 962.96) TaxID=1314807 RepID=A0A4S8KRX0_DENBC|nr:hypothetical protein K435DRAFT_811576 [Dendrothele bispora CBS 962.96]